ncbi:MAG TPA: hypothetical protein VHE83_18985 [Mycobacteriales bacterium]|nr:hypothetical protein [Mycobacteriales bacterium]
MARIPSPGDVVKAAQAQTEALLQLPSLLIQLTQQVRYLTDGLAALSNLAVRVDNVMDELEPGLKRLARALDNPAIDAVPETIRQIQENALPVIKQLRDTQSRIAAIAESTGRLASIPGASLFRSRPRGDDGTPEA